MNPKIETRPAPLLRASAQTRIGVSGRVQALKFNRAGERVPVRVDRSRRAFQRVWEHQQSNLITDAGMDYAVGQNPSGFAWNQINNYIAVGTSSVEPAVGQTSLGAEIARTNQTLSFGLNGVASHPEVGAQEFTRVRAFDFGEANGNLTEFGGFAVPSAGSALIRELFRDEIGTAVPITKTSDEQLVIIHTARLEYAPTSMTSAGSISITGFGGVAASHMFYRAHGGTYFIQLGSNYGLSPVKTIGSVYDTQNAVTFPTNIGGATNAVPQYSEVLAYVGGSFQRDFATDYTGQAADEEIRGFAVWRRDLDASQSFTVCGWRFDDPAMLLKDKDYRLSATVRFQFARA